MKRIFYSLLFAGTVWTAAGQNPPEIKTPDRKTAERIEEYYLSKMLPDSVQIKAPSLYPADYFSPSTTMTPVISMSSLMEIRTKYALRRIDIVPYKIRSGWFSISNGQAQNWSPYPDGHLDARTPLVSRTAVTTPILRCAAGHRGRPYRFSNRHSVSRSEFAPGNFRFRLPHPQIWVFMRNGFRQKNRFFAHLLMCSL